MIEADLYEPIKIAIKNLLSESNCNNIHIEITATNRFSNQLKQKFGKVLYLLDKSFSPDLSGVYTNFKEKIIIIEVKKDELTIQNIYQTIAYYELVGADIGILISPKNLPVKIKTFLDKRLDIIQKKDRHIFIAVFDLKDNKIAELSWYPLQPKF